MRPLASIVLIVLIVTRAVIIKLFKQIKNILLIFEIGES